MPSGSFPWEGRQLRAVAALLSSAMLVAGCTGAVGDRDRGSGGEGAEGGEGASGGDVGSNDNGGRGGSGSGGSGGTASACKAPSPGPIAMRRLTKRQFTNSVKELFGAAADVATEFPETSIRKGYRTFAEANTVTADGAEQIAGAATTIASKVTTNVAGLLGCTPGTGPDDACARGYFTKLARKAYRRPPEATETDVLNKVYADLRGQGWTQAESVAGVIETVLQSPQFLYLSELGTNPTAATGAVVPLTDHEVAARLSFGLWDSLPDADLVKLADEGKLHERADVEAQARRMVMDKRAEPLFSQFVEDWLELYRLDRQTKDAQRFPEWNATFGPSLRAEVTTFATEVAFRGDRAFATLMGAPWTMADNATAAIYGVPTGSRPAAGTGFKKVDLDGGQRAGVLTSGAFLASHASSTESLPVVRGVTVRNHVLCGALEVPPGLNVTSPAPDPGKSGRERFTEHSKNAACAACHAMMDPIGFGLEGYDALGRWRTTEGNNIPVKNDGEIREAGDATGTFAGGAELGGKLAGSSFARDCFARQMFTYLNARPYDDELDGCSASFVEKRFADAKGDIRELIVGLAVSDPFLFRRMPERAQ